MQQENQNNNEQQENNDVAETEEDSIGVGTSKQSKLMLIVVGTIFVSGVIYFMFLKEPANVEKKVDTDVLIMESKGQTPATMTDNIDYNTSDLLDVVISEDNLLSPKTEESIPELPELPSLPEEIKQQLTITPKEEEETFTKEEVDKMIDEKLNKIGE